MAAAPLKQETCSAAAPRLPHSHSSQPAPSRGTRDPQGAFGGDFGELAGAIATYLNMTGMPKGADAIDLAVKKIFNAFMADNASPKRPFYL